MRAPHFRADGLAPAALIGENCAIAGYSAGMPVRFIFRCQFCDAQPHPLTQINLEKAMRENTWGAYQNALPEYWLVFHGARAVRLGALRLRGAPRRSRGPPARALRHDWLARMEAPAVPVESRSFRYRSRLDRCNAPTRERLVGTTSTLVVAAKPRGPASPGGPAEGFGRGSLTRYPARDGPSGVNASPGA